MYTSVARSIEHTYYYMIIHFILYDSYPSSQTYVQNVSQSFVVHLTIGPLSLL